MLSKNIRTTSKIIKIILVLLLIRITRMYVVVVILDVHLLKQVMRDYNQISYCNHKNKKSHQSKITHKANKNNQ